MFHIIFNRFFFNDKIWCLVNVCMVIPCVIYYGGGDGDSGCDDWS